MKREIEEHVIRNTVAYVVGMDGMVFSGLHFSDVNELLEVVGAGCLRGVKLADVAEAVGSGASAEACAAGDVLEDVMRASFIAKEDGGCDKQIFLEMLVWIRRTLIKEIARGGLVFSKEDGSYGWVGKVKEGVAVCQAVLYDGERKVLEEQMQDGFDLSVTQDASFVVNVDQKSMKMVDSVSQVQEMAGVVGEVVVIALASVGRVRIEGKCDGYVPSELENPVTTEPNGANSPFDVMNMGNMCNGTMGTTSQKRGASSIVADTRVRLFSALMLSDMVSVDVLMRPGTSTADGVD